MEKITTDQEIAQRNLTYHLIELSWHESQVTLWTEYLAEIAIKEEE